MQIVPRGDHEIGEKKYSLVSVDRIWYVDMPSQLGGRRRHQKVLRKMGKFERLGAEFWRQDLTRQVQSRAFDYQLYSRNAEIYFRRMTKTYGWNRRDWSQDWATDFFSFFRLVNFSWAQALMREHVIDELNRLFVRLGVNSEIEVNGLPTAKDILEVRIRLLAGSISFDDVSDLVRL